MMRRREPDHTARKLAIGSLLAATAGYLAGLLTAPKSGKETREDIQAITDKKRVEAEKDLKKLHTELDLVIKDAKVKRVKLSEKAQAEMKLLIERALDTKEKAREIISAIHEGDAEDEELKRAVQNANNALENLRNFLKK